MTGIDDLAISTAWQIREGEMPGIFDVRISVQKSTWWESIKRHGHLYLIKFNDYDIRPMWEDQIDAEKLRKEVYSPLLMPLDCPLCQPYDYFDTLSGQYVTRRYLTKIVDPKYPEGFIDKEGVYVKCPCLLKGDDRKWLKFRSMHIDKEK